jgi:hypothetical protein
MPCPFFEPRSAVASTRLTGVRLPLIDEYSGLCHSAAGENAVAVDAGQRLQCNHGYAGGLCPRFPPDAASSALRYSVSGRSTREITLVWLEEQDHSPLRWGSLRYSIAEDTLSPLDLTPLIQAQALAFCRSFLLRLRMAEQPSNV